MEANVCVMDGFTVMSPTSCRPADPRAESARASGLLRAIADAVAYADECRDGLGPAFRVTM